MNRAFGFRAVLVIALCSGVAWPVSARGALVPLGEGAEGPEPSPPAPQTRREQVDADPALHAKLVQSRGLMIAGGACGGATIALGVVGGLWLLGNALNEGPWRREDFVGPGVTWGIAGAFLITGTVLATVGGVRRARLLREPAVALGPGSLTLRF